MQRAISPGTDGGRPARIRGRLLTEDSGVQSDVRQVGIVGDVGKARTKIGQRGEPVPGANQQELRAEPRPDPLGRLARSRLGGPLRNLEAEHLGAFLAQFDAYHLAPRPRPDGAEPPWFRFRAACCLL